MLRANISQQIPRTAFFDDAVVQYARDNGVLLWSKSADDAWDCKLAVASAAHSGIKKFLQARRAAATTANPRT